MPILKPASKEELAQRVAKPEPVEKSKTAAKKVATKKSSGKE